MKKLLSAVILFTMMLSFYGCLEKGKGVDAGQNTTEEKQKQLDQLSENEEALKNEILLKLNINTNNSSKIGKSVISKNTGYQVYFAVSKLDTTVNGNTGIIRYKYAYSEDNNPSTLIEGIITYTYEWKQINGKYQWDRTGTNLEKSPAKLFGTIKGKIINIVTKTAMAGVRVYAERIEGKKVSMSVQTDVNGLYEINGIETGEYKVKAYTDQFEVNSGTGVTIEQGVTKSITDIEMVPQVSEYKMLIKGRVIDGDGNPLRGSKVEVQGNINATVYTDTTGNYEFRMITAGAYKVIVTKEYKTGFETKEANITVSQNEVDTLREKVIEPIYLQNKAPVITMAEPASGNRYAYMGQKIDINVSVTDADNIQAGLTYEWKLPNNAQIPLDAVNHIEWSAPNEAGIYEIVLTVYDNKGGVSEKRIFITVGSANGITANAGSTFSWTIGTGTGLGYELTKGPAGMTVSADGVITWNNVTSGSNEIEIKITSEFGSDYLKFTLTGVLNILDIDISINRSVPVGADGRYIYSIKDNTVVVTDTETNSTVTTVNLSAKGNDIYLNGSKIYVSAGGKITVIDVSSPASPSVVSETTITYGTANRIPLTNIFRIAQSGGYTYYAAGYDGVVVMEMSGGGAGVFIGKLPVDGMIIDIAIHDNLAYAADKNGTVYVIDISNTSQYRVVSKYTSNNTIYSLQTVNGNIYAAGSGGIEILGTGTDGLILKGSYNSFGGKTIVDIKINGNYAYATDTDGNIYIIDISNPSNPVMVKQYTNPNYKVVIRGGKGVIIDIVTNQIVNVIDNDIFIDISSTPVTTVDSGTIYSYQVSAQVTGSGTTTYELITAPAGMTISTSGLVTWTPATAGTYDIRIKVTCGGAVKIQEYEVTVKSAAGYVVGQLYSTPIGDNKRVFSNDSNFSYTNGFVNVPADINWYNNYSAHGKIGGEINFKVKTTSLSLFSTRDSASHIAGKAEVYIDDVLHGYMDNQRGALQMGVCFFTASGLSNTEHRVKIKVIDDYGSEYGAGFNFIDIDKDGYMVNNSPIINTVTLSKNNISGGTATIINVDATSPVGKTLTYSYSVTEGAITGTGNNVVYTVPNKVGTYTVNVIVSDGIKETTSSINVNVINIGNVVKNFSVQMGGTITIDGYNESRYPARSIPQPTPGGTTYGTGNCLYYAAGYTAGTYYFTVIYTLYPDTSIEVERVDYIVTVTN